VGERSERSPQSGQGPDAGKGKNLSDAFSLTSRREPIYIQADGLEFDYEAKRVVYHGSVVVTQGKVVIHSDALTVIYEEGDKGQKLREVVATGHVVFTEGDRQAKGEKAVFDEESRTVTLSGDAMLREGLNQVEGETVVIFLDEGRSQVTGGKERVKAVFYLQNPALSPVEGNTAAGEKERR
jgi:lipopolysaccharide export system protein LptA